jgi:type II secretory pathway pseudopilin PulG
MRWARSIFSRPAAAGRARITGEAGFSLVETMISIGLLTTVALSVAQLMAVATQANVNAKGQTSATLLAEQKMEQLRSLTWGFDADGMGLPESDTSTNLSQDPPTSDGPGLNPSPAGSLLSNVSMYHDFLDPYGTRLGTGGSAPAGTTFVRRWSVDALPTNPNNTLVIQVQVTPIARDAARSGVMRLRDEVRLVGVKTRKAQ